MDNKSVFNATVCIIGIAIFLIHTINILLKKDRRKDENNLLFFIIFSTLHLAAYLAFTIIKVNYTSDGFIIGFYTTFYIMNNVQLLLFFYYAVLYIGTKKKMIDVVSIINICLFGVYVILDIVNIFNHMFFDSVNGVYTRAKTMFFSQGYQLFAFATVFALAVFNKKLKPTEKIAFSVYCILPLIAIVLQNRFAGYAIAYLSVIIAVEVLFLFINVRKNMELAQEAKRNKEIEIKIMMSQIKPHFVYNTLASISTLIKIDPDKAQKGLDNFTEYLRTNLSSLTDTGLILFSDELRHIETYLALEKMRFEERLNVVYDIKARDFMVPPLSIQPIVENAVKHGILKKIEGGVISIKSFENKNAFVIEIRDDGIGFNPEEVTGPDHIGLKNVKYRIETMCRGDIKVSSELNKGTRVTVYFYK